MSAFQPIHTLSPHAYDSHFLADRDDDDADTASQRSISLSSAPVSPRDSTGHTFHSAILSTNGVSEVNPKRESLPFTIDTDFSSEADNSSMYTHEMETHESPSTSAPPSVHEESKPTALPTYPPAMRGISTDAESITSFASETSSRKARPESMLMTPSDGPLVLGIALVDFNHLVGPKIEYSKGDIFDDEEVLKILPFLALPDGAHLSAEDYSYFHLVPSGPKPTTIFGISCNQQIAASALLVKDVDVTRSTVQKAVVVLASKPVFGPIRDKLGVVTSALFNQRDFRETNILDDFFSSLETSLRSQLTESGFYMGTSLRELVHKFRQRTLVLVKALMLQKKIMFYGHPVERLCTYQYSLVSLIPGLLQTLDDCGSPPLAARAPTLSQATSLKTSDRKSMMNYMGLPLDIFGKDAFFQPYAPLQQLDMLKDTKSWLCGSTNSIVTQQADVDLLVNTETETFEYRDPNLERVAGLTAADRKWMDDIVKDVNEGWNDDDTARPAGMQFKGSDDYLRSKFEEYIFAALSSVKYRDFIAKGEGSGVLITGGSGGGPNSTEDFNPLWISDFKKTNAYEVWQRITDPLLFDIVEPRHPCNEKPSVVADIGLRLQEGIQDLKLEQQLAPTREAISRTFAAGSTNFFKAVEGVRGRWQRTASSTSSTSVETSDTSSSTPPVEISRSEAELKDDAEGPATAKQPDPPQPPSSDAGSPLAGITLPTIPDLKPTLATWGTGIGSFLSTRAARFSMARAPAPADATTVSDSPAPSIGKASTEPAAQTPRSQLHLLTLSTPAASPPEASATEAALKTPKNTTYNVAETALQTSRSQLRSLTLRTDPPTTPSAASSFSKKIEVNSPVSESPVGESPGMAL